jgi:hypothetical protein
MTAIEHAQLSLPNARGGRAAAAETDYTVVGEALEPAAILLSLLAAFTREGVAHCYWKSRRRIDRALSGQSDLDLLIAKNDRRRAVDILYRQGFKYWPDRPWRDHPALLSFFGYDGSECAIYHVHIHFQLVLGHSLIKNFRVPIEDRLLARSVPHRSLPIRILDPTDETLLLVVRANLDMSFFDPVALRRWSGLRRKYADALADLTPIVDRRELKDRAGEIFSPKLADRIVRGLGAICAGKTSRGLRIAIARELSAFRIYSDVGATVRGLWRSALSAAGGLNKHYFGAPRLGVRRTLGGGALVTIVGVDGSGKSTLLREVRCWLDPQVDLMTCYFGTGDGQPSLFFRPIKAVSRSVARVVRTRPKGASHGAVSNRPPGLGYSVMFAIWAIAVAIEKRRKIVSTQRAINRGFVVVTDRYPQNEILEFNDGPLLHRLPRCPAWLRRFESSVYGLAQRAPPDLVIKLLVGPETVARREPLMINPVIHQRVASLKELKFSASRVVSIDATRPLEEVHREAKRAIWSIL